MGKSDTSQYVDRGLLAPLRLSVEERERVTEAAADLIAVHVYRELRTFQKGSEVAGCSIIGNCSNGSCDIIGNCSSSSKSEL